MSNFLMHPDPPFSLLCVARWTERFQGHKFFSSPYALQNHTDTVNSLKWTLYGPRASVLISESL